MRIPNKPRDLPLYLSLKEVAAILGLHYGTVWKMVHKHTMPAVRIGGVYRLSAARLMRMMEAAKTGF